MPEGIALIRNNEVVYANKSLYHLLDIADPYRIKGVPLNSMGGLSDRVFENMNLKQAFI